MYRHYDDPKFADVVVCFGEHKVHAHKVILSMASGFFRGAFEGGFKVLHASIKQARDTDLMFAGSHVARDLVV